MERMLHGGPSESWICLGLSSRRRLPQIPHVRCLSYYSLSLCKNPDVPNAISAQFSGKLLRKGHCFDKHVHAQTTDSTWVSRGTTVANSFPSPHEPQVKTCWKTHPNRTYVKLFLATGNFTSRHVTFADLRFRSFSLCHHTLFFVVDCYCFYCCCFFAVTLFEQVFVFSKTTIAVFAFWQSNFFEEATSRVFVLCAYRRRGPATCLPIS